MLGCPLTLSFSDDDDDDDEEEDRKPSGTTEVKPSVDAEVKPEPGEEGSKKPKKSDGPPSHDLHIYTVVELENFEKRQMLADTELLDGERTITSLMIFSLIYLQKS